MPAASAHVAYARPTLARLAQGAALVAEVEILSPPMPWSASDASARCEFHRARVVDVMIARSGDAGAADPEGEIEFFLHAEGRVDFVPGDRVLLFAQRASGRPEFAGEAKRFAWYSTQGPGQEWKLDGEHAVARRAAARAWVGGVDGASPQTILLAQLESGDRRLQEDAILEMVGRSRGPAYLESEQDRKPFLAVLDQGKLTPSHARALRVLLSRPRGAGRPASP